MNRTWLVVIGVTLIVFVAGAAQFLFPRTAVSPVAPATPATTTAESTSTPVIKVKNVTVSATPRVVPSLPTIAKGDTITAWNFKGAYADNPALITKAETEIKRLIDLIGKGTYSDMSLYVAIANQYELLGNGTLEYDYLGRAIKADVGATSGLPWHNLGVLMERLGALETARIAYKESTLIQPEMKFYHYAYFEFLTTRLKDDVTDIEKEYAAAVKNLGQDTDILQLYSEWKQL